MGSSLIASVYPSEIQYGRFTRWNLIIIRARWFFFFSYSKDYASWFQNWKNDDFTRLRYYKKKVIENIPFVNVSNQFGNVMKLELKVLLLLFSFFELLMKSWVHFVPSLITIYMQNYHTIIR